MKKILKASSWNTDELTSENIANKSHWFVKFLDAALTALDIGSYSFVYSNYELLVSTANFGSFSLDRPSYYIATDFIAYIDSDNKELLMCASHNQVVSTDLQTAGSNTYAGYVRGPVRTASSSIARIHAYGGLYAIKFENGTNFAEISPSGTNEIARGFTNNCCGCPLPTNNKCIATPITATTVKISKKPIFTYAGTNYTFEGKYFESIYICDKYFLGTMKSSDNKYFYYNGYIFKVDDARDIEVINTTV